MPKPIYFVGFIVISLALIGGQLLRWSIGGATVTALDITVAGWAIVWLWGVLTKSPHPSTPRFLWWGIGFSVLAIVSLIGALRWVDLAEIILASSYLIRWVAYATLVYLGYILARSSRLIPALGAVFGSVALLGIIQWLIVPNLGFLEQFGWDPHQGRLVSTFLDPNFVGGFLAVGTALSIPQIFASQKLQLRWYWGVILTLALVGVYLTFSRSALLALLIAIGVVGILRYRLFSAVLLTVVTLSCLASPRWLERGRGAITLDQTARYRIASWNDGLNIIQHEPLIGVGFNTLPSTRSNYGYTSGGHSASGFDSSLLTIGATTGGLGLIAYLGLLVSALLLAWRRWRSAASPVALTFLAATSALLVHSLFVNSLLYPSVLVVWWIILGLVWAI